MDHKAGALTAWMPWWLGPTGVAGLLLLLLWVWLATRYPWGRWSVQRPWGLLAGAIGGGVLIAGLLVLHSRHDALEIRRYTLELSSQDHARAYQRLGARLTAADATIAAAQADRARVVRERDALQRALWDATELRQVCETAVLQWRRF